MFSRIVPIFIDRGAPIFFRDQMLTRVFKRATIGSANWSRICGVFVVGETALPRRRSIGKIAAASTRKRSHPAQSAAPLIAVSKLFASKAGIVWIRPRRWLEYQTENASIAAG